MLLVNAKLVFLLSLLNIFQRSDGVPGEEQNGKLVRYDINQQSSEESADDDKILHSDNEITKVSDEEDFYEFSEETIQLLDDDKEKRKRGKKRRRNGNRRRRAINPMNEVTDKIDRLQCRNAEEKQCRLVFIDGEFRFVCQTVSVVRCN